MLTNSFWKGRRVLVTGHTGFKGSWITLWLLSMGADVWGASLQPDCAESLFSSLQLDQQKAETFSGELHHNIVDICDFQSLSDLVRRSQPEVVIHLAAQALVRRSYEQPLSTWATNVQGSVNILEALRRLTHRCSVVMVTTDKVYENQEWDYGYRESDRLGGRDPYSASKAAAELAIASWRDSFCGNSKHQTTQLAIATARAGNVIGGGDWALDRLVPDAIRSIKNCQPIYVRSPWATRPWQHVLEPLGAYLLLSERLHMDPFSYAEPFNFGPSVHANRSVKDLLEQVFSHWAGTWKDESDPNSPHEANRLHLQIDKAYHQLGWSPRWNFVTSVERTVRWYRNVHEGMTPFSCCLADLEAYQETLNYDC